MSQDAVAKIDTDIQLKQAQIEAMSPNMSAIDAYKKKDEEYRARWKDLEKVRADKQAVSAQYESLRKQRLDMFMEGFSIITDKLKEMYRMLTFGGDADLDLVDSIDPFSEGVAFSVRPPRKSWKVITNLSGGEKTLASMSLIFALHHFRPTPLYCMDEIDAALDFKNVSIVANYIKSQTKDAQFIVISLRNNMFDLADRLVGIYKTNNVSKSITIDPKNFKVPGKKCKDAKKRRRSSNIGAGGSQQLSPDVAELLNSPPAKRARTQEAAAADGKGKENAPVTS